MLARPWVVSAASLMETAWTASTARHLSTDWRKIKATTERAEVAALMGYWSAASLRAPHPPLIPLKASHTPGREEVKIFFTSRWVYPCSDHIVFAKWRNVKANGLMHCFWVTHWSSLKQGEPQTEVNVPQRKITGGPGEQRWGIWWATTTETAPHVWKNDWKGKTWTSM